MTTATAPSGTTLLNSPVLTRNQQSGPTVFRDKHNDVLIEWGPKGSPNGDDYQPIPPSLLNHPQFVKVIRQGVVTIEDDSPEVQEALSAQTRIFNERQQRSTEDIDRSMDDAPNRDYITQPCIGPASRGTGTCGVDVPIKQEHKGGIPPLCDTHKGLQHEYVLSHGDTLDEDGKPETKWLRSTVSREALPSQEG